MCVDKYITSRDRISIYLEMANMVGNKVKTERIRFSFYFSGKGNINHAIRVKIVWNNSKMTGPNIGFMELHGDYAYTSSSGNKKISNDEITAMRKFFKKYKVLFAGVWEGKIGEHDVKDYFTRDIYFKDLLKRFNVPESHKKAISSANSISDLERIVRAHRIFNMND